MTENPTYDPAFVDIARTLAARGAVDHDIAVALGVKLQMGLRYHFTKSTNCATLRSWPAYPVS